MTVQFFALAVRTLVGILVFCSAQPVSKSYAEYKAHIVIETPQLKSQYINNKLATIQSLLKQLQTKSQLSGEQISFINKLYESKTYL